MNTAGCLVRPLHPPARRRPLAALLQAYARSLVLSLVLALPPIAAAQAPQPLAAPQGPGKADTGWARVKAPGPDELWYDRDKLVFSGGDITYWRRVDFALPQQFRTFQVASALFREQINCDDHTIRVASMALELAEAVGRIDSAVRLGIRL